MIEVYHITGINPEPWVAPEHGLGRKGGKAFVQVYKSSGLSAYQEAIQEEIVRQNGHVQPYLADREEFLQVTFHLWRTLDQSEVDGLSRNRNWADATNMQKALEDALQGILYKNDRLNKDVRTIVHEQGPSTMPHITIEIHSGEGIVPPEVPARPVYVRDRQDRSNEKIEDFF
jgi:Holliday junction resolvase RusA-like endonuclease